MSESLAVAARAPRGREHAGFPESSVFLIATCAQVGCVDADSIRLAQQQWRILLHFARQTAIHQRLHTVANHDLASRCAARRQ